MGSATQEFDDDEYPSSAEDVDTIDDEVLQPGVHPLGLSKDYVPDWHPRDAFRELYQNWKDAIVDVSSLDPRFFVPVVKDSTSHIDITVRSDQTMVNETLSQKLLGYIRFDKKAGTVELTNFKSALNMKHLYLGASGKRNKNDFAGTHSEGFKLAALVLGRAGLAIRFTSSSFYWNFGFRDKNHSTLSCRLSQVKESRLQSLKKQFRTQASRSKFERSLTSNIWEDVTVKISKPRGQSGVAISEIKFKEWMQVTIELDPPAPDKIITTDNGDLILNPRFKGAIYLKGLRIVGHEVTYAHGYNFASGKINRDRDRLADLGKEKQSLSSIWGDSILSDANIADIYADLLQTQAKCAETLWTCDTITKPPIEIVWRRLRESHPSAFFHLRATGTSETNTSNDADIIRIDFKKAPFPVSKELWDLLRKFSLVHSPQEEQNHRFGKSSIIPSNQDAFHVSIVRTLKGSFSLDPALRLLDFCFVDGGGTSLDLMFDADAQSIKIHQKWLGFDEVHTETTCEIYDLVNKAKIQKGSTFCDHVIEDLFERILEKIGGPLDISQSRQRSIRGQARSCLRLMPRSVHVSQVQRTNIVEVTWVGNEDGFVSLRHGDDIQYLVILHKEGACKVARSDIICSASVGPDFIRYGARNLGSSSPAQCGCPAQCISRTDSKAFFDGLSVNHRYFPMVARVSKISFFGCPPQSIKLKSEFTRTPRSSRKNLSPSISTEFFPSSSQVREEPMNSYPSTPVVDTFSSFDISALPGPADLKWQNWFQMDMLPELARFRTCRESFDVTSAHSVGSLECPHLEFKFEKDEYACIRLGNSGAAEFPVFVHGIFSEDEDFDQDTTYLLATRYSFLRSVLPLRKGPSAGQDSASLPREAILHYHEQGKMGLREDAETIKLDQIVSAQPLIDIVGMSIAEIDHLVQPLQDSVKPSIFCRFAIGNARHDTEACLTPIASHLLLRQDRWKEVKFSNSCEPVVYDLSPDILGPSEGLRQAGYAVTAGLNFDPAKHLTWRTRNHSSQVYDGSSRSILEILSNGQLQLGSTPDLTVPRIVVIAGSNVPFQSNNRNESLPCLEQFLKVLVEVEAANQSSLKPTFIIMFASAAILHNKAGIRLDAAILALLERRLSVHTKVCSLEDFGCPLQRDILVLIASSLSSSVPWNMYWPTPDRQQPATIESLIHDLAFKNPWVTDELNSGFACLCSSESASSVPQTEASFYNHNTGRQMPHPLAPLDWQAIKFGALTTIPKPWIHPIRLDRLTVRELARLQGLPDELIFYHCQDTQYKDIWAAIPPAISKAVGQTIRYMLQRSQAVKMGERVHGSKGKKRARVDNGMEE